MFTKRHYKRIAEILNHWKDIPSDTFWVLLIIYLCIMFKEDNQAFDANSFVSTCLGEEK